MKQSVKKRATIIVAALEEQERAKAAIIKTEAILREKLKDIEKDVPDPAEKAHLATLRDTIPFTLGYWKMAKNALGINTPRKENT